MKQRLNILCAIVLVVMSYSILETGYYFMRGVFAGVMAVSSEVEGVSAEELLQVQHAYSNIDYKYVHLMPENGFGDLRTMLTDSVYNEKSGTKVPVGYSALMLGLDGSRQNFGMTTLIGGVSLINFGFAVWAFLLFISLIRSINHSDIFSWKNVRRLRLLGFSLLMCFFLKLTHTFLSYHEVGSRFALQGYTLNYTEVVEMMTCVLGLCSLIVGEVFAIGLKMKEEQELTI